MTVAVLLQKIQENLSSGTLSMCDDVIVTDEIGNRYTIVDSEPDSQTSDYLISIE